jgi:acetoin utilization deacetylase AcuC-like enzyme
VRAALAGTPDVTILEAPPITWDDALLAHHPEWVRRVRYGLLDRRESAGLGLPWSPELAARSLHATGSTVAAARAALQDGTAAALGGGTHHARHRTGRGYCVFNDVAIAIARLRRDGLAGDLLVLDLDVHQGDGNAELFADDPTVTVVSLHGARNYPFERVPSDLDVDLPDGTGDDAYLEALDAALAWALEGRGYALAFLIAGADPWEHDALGRLSLSEAGLERRDHRALTALRAADIPVCVTLAGGYGRPIEGTARIHARTVALAATMCAC